MTLVIQLVDAEVVLCVAAIPQTPRGLVASFDVLHETHAGAPVVTLDKAPIHGIRALELAEVESELAVCVLLALCQ